MIPNFQHAEEILVNIRKSKGFTLIELLLAIAVIVIIVIGVWVVGISGIIMGNFWFTEAGVLKKIQLQHSDVTRIVDVERSVWSYSAITVQDGEERKILYLDSDILFNYDVGEAEG